jgi:glycosyltransferase involved in cell wall biosynthesis
MFPRSPWWRENPYLDLLEGGLRQHGVACAKDPNDGVNWRWLLAQRGQVQVLHFHWLEYHYDRPTPFASVVALVAFILKVVLAKGLGYRIVWTVHNLQPHEQKHPKLDYACWWIMARLAHVAIAHCQDTRCRLIQRFALRRHAHIHVLPHPNYVGVYPNTVRREEARQQLGLAQASTVYLYFGAVRPYKGIEEATVAFKTLADEAARLMIVGRPLNEEITKNIHNLTGEDTRILTVFEYVPAEQVPLYYAAADVVVLPFRNVTTSGSAILAMSLGKPVLATALGCLPELLSDETGLLYDPAQPNALAQAMQRSCHLNLQAMGKNALARVAPHTPQAVAAEHVRLYV